MTPSLFGPAPPEAQPVLARACLILIEHYIPLGHPWREQAFADLEALAGDVVPAGMADRALLNRIHDQALKGRIEEAPLAAMVARTVRGEAHRPEGNALSAWVLVAALRRLRISPAQNAISAGLDAMRKLKGLRPEALALLAPLPADPEAILTRLEAAETAAATNRTVARDFREIAALLRSARDEDEAITRERSPLPVSPSTAPDGQTYLAGGGEAQGASFAGPAALQEADRPATARVAVARDAPGNLAPRPVAARRALQVARLSARRALALPAEHDPLTPHELRVLLAACKAGIDRPVWRFLLARLCYGMALPGEDGGHGRWEQAGPGVGLALSPSLPDFASLIDEAGPPPATRLILSLPQILQGNPVPRADAAAAEPALRRLRPQLARPLTLSRITRFKADWLRREGVDAAVSGFLLGLDPRMRAQMHYTALPVADLVGCHEAYLARALDLEPGPRFGTRGLHGSRLRLPRPLLRLVFEEHRAQVARLRPGPRAGFLQLAAAHNAFAHYTLMVLHFATGHRPVSQPFERLADFDRTAGLLWISDKVGRGGRGTRLVALAPTARAQLEAWCGHLERLAERLALTFPDLVATHIRPALDETGRSDAPLFFLLGDPGEIRWLTPRLQAEAAADVLPTALNWTRHVLRSELVRQGFGGAVLDAFLGHAHLGEEGFGATSGLGLRHLYRLAQAVEAILADHGVRPLEGPL